ncbi:transcriptional regulator [Vibrio vulnificus]|uniref:transcriptional regulator n=1 Tax=Vibrio vulnificus TaxID=672 RepID=UPI001F5CBF94|nr:transcriptional regulator [Vibrio vulnificus]MCU8188322.1 transcriptional regulator [Vibrio vulnificus]MCU8196771.1 transcriptional regulator [Vibrio vulnificus]MCU8311270.1 transcriptional regulator [Vibrio vulnificus]
MFNGHVPGPEFLQAIRRAENVNLNWLLTGEGAPYIVEYFQSADALSDYVSAMLHDEPWVVYVCSHVDTACLVLTQPGAYEFKGKFVDYNVIHVLVGPGDDVLANVLNDHNSDGGAVFVPFMTDNERKDLMAGKTGTYELLGGLEPLLNPRRAGSHISDIEFTGGERTEKPVDITIMRAVVRLVDDCEHTLGTSLTSDQRARVITAVYRQAERLKLTEEEIQATIETSLDVLSD